VTGESKRDTEPWIEQHGAKFPYAYDKGGRFQSALGISGIPHAVLVSPAGKIVWRGHPSSLSGAMLEQHLEGALTKPLWEWPATTQRVRQHLARADFGRAMTEADRLGDEALTAEVKGAIESLVALHVGALEAAYERGDYWTVDTDGKALVRALGNLPQAERVGELVDDVGRDRDKQRIVRAQGEVIKIRDGRMRNRRDIEHAISLLERLARDHEGTYAATQAQALRDELQKRLSD
jgi:hypothetical protein